MQFQQANTKSECANKRKAVNIYIFFYFVITYEVCKNKILLVRD